MKLPLHSLKMGQRVGITMWRMISITLNLMGFSIWWPNKKLFLIALRKMYLSFFLNTINLDDWVLFRWLQWNNLCLWVDRFRKDVHYYLEDVYGENWSIFKFWGHKHVTVDNKYLIRQNEGWRTDQRSNVVYLLEGKVCGSGHRNLHNYLRQVQ